MIGVGNNVIFARLCKVINREDLVSNERFKENVDRVKNNAELEAEIELVLAGKSSKDWVELLAASGVPADHLALPEDLLNDPQAAALDILVDYPDPSSKVKKIPGLPFRIDGTRPGIRNPAPHKDEHQ
jgi:crotonobetainyl-CoA:carnitine CoA-transferase CaiB-like acyl-CoA transferase